MRALDPASSVSQRPQISPDISGITTNPSDTDEVLRERVRLAMPRILADMGRRIGEATWSQAPGSAYMAGADKARMIRETTEAFQRNLSQRSMHDIAEEAFVLLAKRRDGARE
jgi:hypothetical protein